MVKGLSPPPVNYPRDLFSLVSFAMNHVSFGSAIQPILHHLGFRTNHEPHMVHGLVRSKGVTPHSALSLT
jgi:hypothetical protein